MSLRIRPARADDAARLLEVWEAAVRATHHFLSEQDVAFYRGVVRDNYLPTADLHVAVEEPDRPVGFLGLYESDIEALFVDPDLHGRGVGRALLQHARALRPDLTVSVNEQNARARGFYEAMGFRAVGRSETDPEGRPFPLIHMALGEA
jgi:putative acetyltransferase